MRHFVDLNLRDPENPSLLLEMLELASDIGFKSVVISSHMPVSQEIKDQTQSIGLDIASRVDLKPKNLNELSKSLRRVRRRFEIVAIQCKSKAISRQAAKDHRVDILNFEFNGGKNRVGLDHQGATLAASSNCAYELTINDLLDSSIRDRPRIIFNMRKDIWNAKQESVPVVISSGARTLLKMREPRAIASIMSLFEIPEDEGLDAVSTNPKKILEKNRKKLEPGFVSPGVREG